MRHSPTTRLRVSLDWGAAAGSTPEPVLVGQLARHERRILFEYDPSFIDRGADLSPLHLPLGPGVREPAQRAFDGLFGVFADSLPDGWGRLLIDRELTRLGIDPASLTPLDRLAHVGTRGMGALVYQPEVASEPLPESVDLHALAKESRRAFDGETDEVLRELLQLGGSSGGARPKVLVQLSDDGKTATGDDAPRAGFAPYIVKFGLGSDRQDVGAVEHAYGLMAKAAGITMEPTRLVMPKGRHPGFFATRRFDRRGAERVHVHSAAGLLHADFRVPSLDYDTLLRATRALTRDEREVIEMFRRMLFNVLAHNRDDHGKNFAFMMERDGGWHLTPAYDLTFSSGPGGEHATMVAGEGRAPGPTHIAELAKRHGVPVRRLAELTDEVRSALGRWPEFAREANVGKVSLERIQKVIAPR